MASTSLPADQVLAAVTLALGDRDNLNSPFTRPGEFERIEQILAIGRIAAAAHQPVTLDGTDAALLVHYLLNPEG